MHVRTWRITAAAACAATLGLAVFAVSASAGTSQRAAGHAAATVNAPEAAFGCRSAPAFRSSKPAAFTGTAISIRSGPFTRCSRNGLGYEGQIVRVWCGYNNSNNVFWVYLRDRTTGVQGWSQAHFVTWSGSLRRCP